MLNVRHFEVGLQIVGKVTGTSSALGDLEVLTTDNKVRFHNGTSSSPIVTESHASQGTHRLQNKDLEDSTLAIVDASDTTKKIKFDAGGTTGTSTTLSATQTADRNIAFPDDSGTVLLAGSPQPITNKTLDDATVWFVDTGDNTKELHFDVTGTTGTKTTIQSTQTANRVLILPDISDTLVSRNTTDTLTNKTLTSPILNTPTADTITGITGGALIVQSDTNQNLTLQSQGTGVVNISGTIVNIQNLAITNDTISGASTADLNIITLNNKNLQLTPNGTGIVIVNSPMENVQNVRWDRLNDSTTTGTGATLNAFTTSYVKVTNASLVSLSAIPAGANGQVLVLSNATGVSVTVVDEDGGVTAANRIRTGTNSSITLNNNTSINLIYDSDSSRWRVTGSVGGPPKLFGSRGSPRSIVAVTGITAASGHMSATEIDQVVFIQGSGGPVIVTASPAIQSGSIIGQRMTLIGRSNANTVSFTNVSGSLELNGDVTLGLGDVMALIWDGTAWVELYRN